MKTEFLTPVGRLVQGDPFEAQTKNMQGQPLVTMSGQPTQRYFIGVAFRKDDPNFPAFYQKLVDVARGSFPNLFNAQGQCSHPRFSWKLMDGDGVDDNGKSNATKEGFAGHWIVKFQSSFAPRCFHAGHYQPHEQIQDPKSISRGYFVRVAGTIEGNDNATKPGLYVNLNMVELAGIGPVISSGPDAASIFGGAAPTMPAGAQPLPMQMPGAAPVAGMPQIGAMPGAAPLPGVGAAVPNFAPPMSVPAASVGPAMMSPSSLAVAPNPAFLAGPGGVPGAVAPVVGMPLPPAASVAIAPPAPPSSPQMTALAGGATYEQFIGNGWTPDAMRAAGYLV